MAESPSPPSRTAPPPPPPPTPPSAADPTTEYWCYQCDKRVPIENLPNQPDVICFECKHGFVELISTVHHQHHDLLRPTDDDDDQPNFGHEFLQVLRLIAQSARDDDVPPLPPSDDRDNDNDNDYLRTELDALNDNDNENNNNDDDEEENEDDVNNDDDEEEDDGSDVEDERRRQRRDVIRLQLRDFATRALTRRNRVLDWAEILMGLEDHSIEFRFQVPGEHDGYIGNPGDYVDAAGYEALLQTLAESDSGSRRGSPPAAKLVVEGLPTVEVMVNDSEVCAICKDKVFNNEKEVVKQLPCGHMYHQDCIVPWLGSRNTCPICRYELPTDDPEYEEDRKKRLNDLTTTASSTSGGGSV